MVSDLLKAAAGRQQVCVEKPSESEPTDDPSKVYDVVKTGVGSLLRDQWRRCLFMASAATGEKEA